jgi:hypothetical protein
MENCGDIRLKDDDVSPFPKQALVILPPDSFGIVEPVLRAQVITGFFGLSFMSFPLMRGCRSLT